MTTPLFLLRAIQLGLSLSDLDLVTIGLVLDMATERERDKEKYPDLAAQEDYDAF